VDERGYPDGLDAQSAFAHAREGAGNIERACAQRTGRHERWRERSLRPARAYDKQGDRPAAAVKRGQRAGVVHAHDMEDNAAVGRVAGMAVLAPAARAEVDLDVATEEVPTGVDDGAGEVRPASAAGYAGKDHPQGAPVLQAQRRPQPRPPAHCELGLVRKRH
jgi:hypothetical protein